MDPSEIKTGKSAEWDLSNNSNNKRQDIISFLDSIEIEMKSFTEWNLSKKWKKKSVCSTKVIHGHTQKKK